MSLLTKLTAKVALDSAARYRTEGEGFPVEGIPRTPHIILLVDRSGSMGSVRDDMLRSMNELITEQKKVVDNSVFTFVTFSCPGTEIPSPMYVYEKVPMANVPLITPEQYQCYGGTALYDTVYEILKKYSNNPDTLLVIVTDGQDMDSETITREMVTSMIAERQGRIDPVTGNNDGWKIIYLCNDISLVNAATQMGITARTCQDGASAPTLSAAVDTEHLGTAIRRQVSQACSAYRATSHVPNLSDALRQLSMRPSTHIPTDRGLPDSFGVPAMKRSLSER